MIKYILMGLAGAALASWAANGVSGALGGPSMPDPHGIYSTMLTGAAGVGGFALTDAMARAYEIKRHQREEDDHHE